MLEAIAGFVSGYLSERLMMKKWASWKISITISLLALISSWIYLYLTTGALYLNDLFFGVMIFAGVFLVIWLLFFYKRFKSSDK